MTDRPPRSRAGSLRPITQKRRFPTRGRGVQKLLKKEIRIVGPGDPPVGFLGPWTSQSEWILYWALAKIFEDPPDPRIPNSDGFTGGQRWEPQRAIMGGRSLGGQVVDFVITMADGRDVAIDLQTEYFHLTVNPYQNALEQSRLLTMARYFEIITIHESNLIADPTGQQAVRTVIDALGGRRRLNPRAAGILSKTRRGRLYGSQGVS
jgi:hypothetical protein